MCDGGRDSGPRVGEAFSEGSQHNKAGVRGPDGLHNDRLGY